MEGGERKNATILRGGEPVGPGNGDSLDEYLWSMFSKGNGLIRKKRGGTYRIRGSGRMLRELLGLQDAVGGGAYEQRGE